MGLLVSLTLTSMFKLLFFTSVVGLTASSPVPNKEEEVRGLLQDIILGQIQNQINSLLGITTTKATPIIDAIGGIIGGETTTTAPASESPNLIESLIGILFPTTTTTTTPTTTTTTTTTKCGGSLGGGLLC